MAQVIQFYVPSDHHSLRRWVPEEDRGKIIEFTASQRSNSSSWLASAAMWAMQPWSPAPELASTCP